MFSYKFNKRVLIPLVLVLIALLIIPSAFAESVDSYSGDIAADSYVADSGDIAVDSSVSDSGDIAVDSSVSDSENIAVDSISTGPNNISTESDVIAADDEVALETDKRLENQEMFGADSSNLPVRPLGNEEENYLYVATDGSDEFGDGSIGRPYATLNYTLSKVNSTFYIIKMADGIYYESGIEIDDSVYIIGESQEGTIIDANFTDRVFDIGWYGSAYFENLTIRNGYTYGYGGGVLVGNYTGTVFVNCTFTGNIAYNSAAIDNSGTLYILDCYFYNNTAYYYDSYYGQIYGEGGAICTVDGHTATIINSTFLRNLAGKNGGALRSLNGGFFNISGCTFTENFAGAYGGAIYNWGAYVLCTKSNFTANEAYTGGAIYSNGGYSGYYSTYMYADFTKCIFTNNAANTSVIFFYNGYAYLEDSIILGSNLSNAESYVLYYAGLTTFSCIDNWWGNTKENADFDTSLIYNAYIPDSYLIFEILSDDSKLFVGNETAAAAYIIHNQNNASIEASKFFYTLPLSLQSYKGSMKLVEDEVDSVESGSEIDNIHLVDGGKQFYFTAEELGKASIIATLFGVSTELNIDVINYTCDLNVEVEGSTLRAVMTFTEYLDVDVGGFVYFTITDAENHSYTKRIAVNNSQAIWEDSNLDISRYTITANYTGDENFSPSILNSSFIIKGIPLLEININDTSILDDVFVEVIFRNPITANVNVIIANKSHNLDVIDGYGGFIWNDLNLSADNYTAYAYFAGNELYYSATANDSFEIYKAVLNPILSVSPNEISFMENLTISVGNLSAEYLSLLKVYDNGKLIDSPFDETGSFVYHPLTTGGHDLIINFTGDDIYEAFEDSVSFTVNFDLDIALLPSQSLINYNEDSTITIAGVPNDYISYLRIFDNGEILDVIIDSDNRFTYSSLKSGEHNISAVYDDGENTVNDSVILTVSTEDVIVVIHSGDDVRDIQVAIDKAKPGYIVNLGENYEYSNISDINITKNLTILSGEDISLCSAEGALNVFNLISKSEGGPDWVNLTDIKFVLSNDVTVLSAKSEDLNGVISDISAIYIENNLFELAEGENPNTITILKVRSDSKTFNPSNQIIVSQNTLISGMSPFVLENSYWENDGAYVIPQSNKIKTVISDVRINYANDFMIFALKDLNGNPLANKNISYVIGDNNYSILTDDDGLAAIDNLPSNSDVLILYSGDSTYDSSNLTLAYVSFDNSKKTSILCDNMSTACIISPRSGEYFIAKLLDEDGKALSNKTVQIGFNGKVYTRTTNATGEFRLQVNLATAGSYTFAISFLGDDEYKASFAVSKIIVFKSDAFLSISPISISKSKATSMKLTLKLANGTSVAEKTVYLKVNGKTYSAKTDSKGVATVKVTISAKGTYTYSAWYNGDGQINKVTKTGKIYVS